MPVSSDFRDFVLDRLADAGHRAATARAMFGGYGLYAEAKIFGVMDDDVVFFRVDDDSRPAFEAAGARPFAPIPGQKPMMSYWEVPSEVLEDSAQLAAWATRAILAAERARAKRPSKSAVKKAAKKRGWG
jgi:DNA transformation protein and related proteins